MDVERSLNVTVAPPAVHDAALTNVVISALEAAELRALGYAFVLDLQTMKYGAWRADENVYPASVIKVPIMAEAFRQYSVGMVRATDRVTVTAANETTTWGTSPFKPGTVATVEELVDRMITHSDNVATNQLMDVLRRENVTDYMRRLGLSTFLLGRKLSGSDPLINDPEMVGRNRLPPDEVGTLLSLIATDRLPGSASQREIMSRCIHAEKVVPGLRPGDIFMHKTGETSEQSHDAGILQTAQGNKYVVVLYTTPEPKPDDSDADHVNPHMARWMSEVRAAL
jgi:beta-lactamase class A